MTNDQPADNSPPAARLDSVTYGTWLAIGSAVCYTASITALRELAHRDDLDWAIWISCLKAAPVCVTAALVLVVQSFGGQRVWPPARTVLELVLTGVVMQAAGNVSFQLSLNLAGMSLAVPLSYATLILSGAVLGRVMLGERISGRSMLAMMVLICSIGVLSTGVGHDSGGGSRTTSALLAASATACVAGVGWALPGVIIRRVVTGEVCVLVTVPVFVLSLTGVVGLGLTTLIRNGPQWMLQTSAADLRMVLWAGLLNTVAFFGLTAALKLITVVRVNLLNASQIALAALAGVLFFGEPTTVWLVIGCVLTVGGLLLMDRPDTGQRE